MLGLTYVAGLCEGLALGFLLSVLFYRLYRRTLHRTGGLVREARLQSERYLASINHEVRTPLNGILGASGLVAFAPLTPDQREAVGIIRRGAESILAVLEAVTDHVALTEGQLRLSPEPLDFLELLEDAVDHHAFNRFGEGVPTTTVIPVDLPTVFADRRRLEQILTYLIGAAACSGASELRVDCKLVDSEGSSTLLQLEIACAGSSHLQDSFLILDLSRALVESMGGYLEVFDEPSSPTALWLVLNLETVQAQSPACPAGPNVVIHCREPLLADMLRTQCGALGMKTSACSSDRTLLTLLQQENVEYLILDADDTDAAIIELARRLAGARLRIMGVGDPASSGHGYDSVLSKPTRRSRLSQALNCQPAAGVTLQGPPASTDSHVCQVPY